LRGLKGEAVLLTRRANALLDEILSRGRIQQVERTTRKWALDLSVDAHAEVKLADGKVNKISIPERWGEFGRDRGGILSADSE
jgi:hypothetical protein